MESSVGTIAKLDVVRTNEQNSDEQTNAARQTSNTPVPLSAPVVAQSADAVTLTLATAEDKQKSQADADAKQKAADKEVKKSIEADIQEALKRFGKTAIEFTTSKGPSDKRVLSFRVVDQETGRVLREFPPDHLPDLLDKAGVALEPAKSLIIDSEG